MKTVKSIYGLFSSPERAQQAVDALRALGIPDPEITIQSSEPLEEYEFGSRDRRTVMSWIAVLGAGIGLLTGYLLTSVTQRAWPIVTGGMPIVSNWTDLMIIFELMMLGAVFATLITLLVAARIPGKLPQLYDAEVSMGMILVGVVDPGNADAVESALNLHSDKIRKL